jgi:CO/xanthine dehydrogenase Mo-binding subunit
MRVGRSQQLSGAGSGAAAAPVLVEIALRVNGVEQSLVADTRMSLLDLLRERLVPVNADVEELDATWIDEHDSLVNPIGAKGVGEIGIVGTAAAITNAAHHVTRIRIRDLPVRPDKLIGAQA